MNELYYKNKKGNVVWTYIETNNSGVILIGISKVGARVRIAVDPTLFKKNFNKCDENGVLL